MKHNWPIVKLGEVLTPVQRAIEPEAGTMYRQLGVRLWGQGAYEREPVDGAQTTYANLFRAETNDIIVNKIWARNGSVALVQESQSGCYGSTEFPMFTPNQVRLVPRWIHWLTKTPGFWAQCDEKSKGTSGKNRIKPSQFLNVEIPLPSVIEQRRIVAQIEGLAAHIHEVLDLRQRAAAEVDTLWLRGAETLLERQTKSCPARKLGEIVSLRGGGTPSKSDPAFWNGNIPWITPKDMKKRELSNSIDHISERATQETSAKLVNAGSILVVVRGMILVHTVPFAILRVPAAINQDMKAMLPIKDVLPEYLNTLLWAYNPRILALVKKSTHDTRKLETHNLVSTIVPVPTLHEQRRIVEELDALQAQVNSLKCLHAETATEIDALMPAILDRAFKGEL